MSTQCEIEITQEMIDEGVDPYLSFDKADENAQIVVTEVFRRMIQALA